MNKKMFLVFSLVLVVLLGVSNVFAMTTSGGSTINVTPMMINLEGHQTTSFDQNTNKDTEDSSKETDQKDSKSMMTEQEMNSNMIRTTNSVDDNERGVMMGDDKTKGESEKESTTTSTMDEEDKPVQTMFVLPTTKESFTFSGDSEDTKINNSSTKEETSISKEKGLRVVIKNDNPVSVEKNKVNGSITLTRGNVVSSVANSDTLKVEGQNILLSGKEIKVMPDVAVSTVNTELGLDNSSTTASEVELKTEEGKEGNTASYKVMISKQAKLFGVFNVGLPITANVNAETGVVTNIQKPWWNFLTF